MHSQKCSCDLCVRRISLLCSTWLELCKNFTFFFCYKLNKLQKSTSGKEDKIIRSEVRELLNHMNCLCKLEPVEKSVILSVCHIDERRGKYCGVAVTNSIKKNFQRGSKDRNKGSPLHTAGKKMTRKLNTN